MRCLIAPDSFKGSLSAVEAARAMAEGVRTAFPEATIVELPIADGGEGTVEVLIRATGGQARQTTVTGPLGSSTVAAWGILGDGTTAVLEMAAASGITLITEQERNPLKATTFGTGELIRAALDAGAKKIIIGIGGSATNDGGAGMAEALGVRFLDTKGRLIKRGGESLSVLERIDISGIDPRLAVVEIIVACDVENVLCGPNGASVVYATQKGASENDIVILDESLLQYADVIRQSLGIDVLTLRGGGAAGGLGAGLAVFCNATLSRGIDLVLDAIGFDDHLRKADVVLTGEGRIDSQMKYGKALTGVLERAARHSVPVLGIAGLVEGPREQYCGKGLFAGVDSLVGETVTVEDAMGNAHELIQRRTSELLQRWFPRRNPSGV
ncbi:MAG: glycerate kinase [Bacteroidota bacterium]